MVAIERAGIWQLSLGCGVDSLQFHGGLGVRKCARRIVENSAVASASFVRCVGGPRRILWGHATRVANTLELSADSPRTAIHRVIPGAARAYDSDGFDVAGFNRRPSFATSEFWAGDRLSVRLEHLGRRSWCAARRRLSHCSVWASWDRPSCGFGGLPRCGDRFVDRKN